MPQVEKVQENQAPITMPSRAKLILAQSLNSPFSWEQVVNLDKLSLQVSKKVLQRFQEDYGQDEEDMYILLANSKTGVIEKICDKFIYRWKQNCSAERGFFKYLDDIAKKQGYFVVGYYHSHPSAKGNGLAGDFISGDDVPAHDELRNDVLRLLGNGVGKVPFQTRAYVPLNSFLLGKEHPLLKRKVEFKRNNLFPVSRYDGEVNENLLELNIVPLDSSVAIDAEDILKNNPPFMLIEKRDLKNKEALSIFEIFRGQTKSTDGFPYLAVETKSYLQIKLRHDGAFTISIVMTRPSKSDRDFDTSRSLTFYFTETGKQDTVNYTELDPRKARAEMEELLTTFPQSFKDRFAHLMDNYKTILDR